MGRLRFGTDLQPAPVADDIQLQPHWIVTVFDNETNTFEQVTTILLLATGCTIEEAEMETWEVHHLGRSVVHHGDAAECEAVGEIIATIGIRVEVTEE